MIGFSDDDALAAEYVLGTLDAPERAAADERRMADPAFSGAIADWEVRLAPLALAVKDVDPPPALLGTLLRRLDIDPDGRKLSNIIDFPRKLRVWRSIAAVTSALAAGLAIWIAHGTIRPIGASTQTYVAVLQQSAGSPSFVVSVDLEHRRMAVMPLGTSAPVDRSYELWMIGANGTPQSLGVIDGNATAHPELPRADSNLISNATYAVTVEPSGGSPTGQPTSAPVFTGKLLDLSN